MTQQRSFAPQTIFLNHPKKIGILLTRPLDDSLALVKTIKTLLPPSRRFHTTYYIQPLLSVDPLPPPSFEYKGEEIIFTSRHGVRFFIEAYGISPLQKATIWCVGEGTENILRSYGINPIHKSSPNGKDLLRKIHHALPSHPSHPAFLHVRGKDVTVDFERELFPHCQSLTLYQTHPTPFLRKSILHAFQHQGIHMILLFSKKSAQTLRNLLQNTHSTRHSHFETIPLLGLSHTILSVFPQNPSSICVTMEDMIKTIEKFILKNEQGGPVVKETF